MEKLAGNKILQKLIALTMIFIMLFSYFPMLSFAADENDKKEEDVVLEVKWAERNIGEDGILNAYTGNSYGLTYNLKFNNIPTGFQDVKLDITNKAGTPIATINANPNAEAENIQNGQYSQIMFGNKNTGKEFGGAATVTFGANSERYDKEIVVTLTGSYRENGETVNFTKQEILKADVIPATQKTNYLASVEMQTNSNGKVLAESVTTNSVDMGRNQYGRSIGWYATQVTAKYPIHINSYTYTQNLKLNVTINRLGKNKLKENGFSIDWGGLDKELGTPAENVNEDGSVTYTFTKGEKGTEFKKDETFALNKDFMITVNYPIPNTNPESGGELKEQNTTCKFTAELEGTGYVITKEYGKEEKIEQVTRKTSMNKSNYVGLCRYTPGNHAWISTSLNTYGNTYLEEEDINNFIENGSIDLSFCTTTDNSCNWGDKEENVKGNLDFSNPTISYLSDSGEVKYKTLNSSQIRVKKIEGQPGVNIIYNNNNIEMTGTTYNMPENIDVSSFSIVLNDFLYKYYYVYNITYTLNTAQLGLTESELKNILSIDLSMSTSGSTWCKGEGSASYYNSNSLGNKYSYMEFLAVDFATDIRKKNQEESKTYTIKMFKNSSVMRTEQLAVVNENPVFYISLPSAFKYSNFNVSMKENPYIAINNEKSHFTTINGEKYLVIACDGVYDSTKQGEIDITIDFTRKLVSNLSAGTQTIYAYMLTDNERYLYEGRNDIRAEKNDAIPEKAFFRTISFNINGSKTIATTTSLERDDNSNVNYEPNPANTTVEYAEKEQPVIVDSNSSVIYKSEIVCAGDTIKNISIISKLPIANNTYINDNDTQLLESDYQLPEAFYKKYGNKIKEFEQGDNITQVSLRDLNIENIKVYKNDNYEMERNKYTLYYSTEEYANFTTDNFIEYHEGDDLSQAKNIMVVFEDDVTLTSGNKYTLQYKMTMPDEKGMVGATTAVKYNKTSDGQESTLYSPVAYVINGITTGTINVTKKFEGLSSGIAPEGINISGIEFKLQYFDEKDNERKFLKDSDGNDVVARTNDKGVATFENIPYGEYYLYEVTKFEKYTNIGNLVLIELEAGETAYIVAENKIKRGNIVINKKWSYTNDNQGQVTFKITRNNNDKIKYEATVVTDENGVAKVVGVPYGNYTVSETQCIPGWISTGNKTVALDTDEKEIDMINRPAYSSLQIIKTVPEGETVDGLTFHISGFGLMSYIDTNGNEVTNNTDITVKIGEDYSSNDNINIEKSENNTTATITLNNLPLGLYNIEEIDIPIIEETEIEKYVSVFINKTLDTDISITKQPETVRISNKYKYGTLDIYKIAKLKQGDTFIDIGDLSQFQVLVSGTSYYGTNVNKVITLDENGYGTTRLEIGEYTVKEVGAEGYTAYYGTDSTATTEPPTVKINYNQTTKQTIYNEHTGVGYVRVEKSLEGVSKPEEVIKEGIQFQVIGQNVAGGRVNEIIEINKIDTEKNVAYGISGAISADGEYELQEVESTIPDYYEGFEPMEINIKTSNTENDPLVINAVNTRTRGNLEIITETNPTGGTLYGITYRVTEVKINTNGTYEKIGESIELEGNNDTINTSFAEMKEINAGYYLVEQVKVPDGWYKDVSQVVEVPSYNTGYANFEITKRPELGDNKVIINKVVLNQNGDKATDIDYENAKLNKNESFEVKLTNVKTGEEYFAFVSEGKRGVIQGLEAGTYRIEEVYKPKYITEGYYQNIEIEPNQIEGLTENVENAIIEHKIDETNGQYLITIGMDGDALENVEITVKNKINTEFGFGGQKTRDNLSKTTIEEDKLVNVSKAVIYVVDENNKEISGTKFRLLNSDGKVVTLNGRGSEFEIANKKLTIRGLEIGKYTLECIEVPDGYLKPENKEIIVFEDATQVARVEVQRNIPRGSITLSTVYTTEDGETKYIPRSKYKVVNKETGELIRFIRTSTGDYKKTNLANGSPVIVLKSGAVEVQGIETGEYEVGIVDVTKEYGIQTAIPENVTIKENTSTNVSIEVAKKNIPQVEAGYQTSMYLDENGDLYAVGGGDSYGLLGDGKSYSQSSQFKKVEFPAGVKISKFSFNNQSVVAIDTEGRAWGWGYCGNGVNGLNADKYSPTLIENGSNKFIDVSISSETGLLLDKDGYVWATGYYVGDGTTDKNTNLSNPIMQFANSGIKVKKLAQMRGYSSNAGVIDTEGKIWMWGPNSTTLVPGPTNSYTPRCISEVAEIEDIEFEELTLTDTYAMALDNEGNLWLWGGASIIPEDMLEGRTIPTKMDSNYFGNKKIKLIIGDSYSTYSSGSYIYKDVAIVVDEDGKVWTWGNRVNGELGNGTNECSDVPVCISDIQESKLYGVEIKHIGISHENSSHIVAVDTNNKIYAWGGSSQYGEAGEKSSTSIVSPQIINNTYNEHLEYNLKFKEVFSEYSNHSFAIDEEGKLWAWGENYNNALGINTNSNNVLIPTEIEVPGNPKIKKVSSYNSTTIILSEDGRVYVCGQYAYTGDGKMVYNSSIIEITSNFNLSGDEKIVDVCVAKGNNFIAIDSEGKVYTWGAGECIGRNDNATQIECISDNDGEKLKGIKIDQIKFNGSFNGCVLAIADNGDLYCWYGNLSPVLLSSGNNFVDIQGRYLLDESGKIWTIDNSNIGAVALECISDVPEKVLYQYYKKDPNYRILKIYNASDYGYNAIIFKDSNGVLWGCNYGSEIFKLAGSIQLEGTYVNTELMPKNFTSISGWLLLDEYGQVWVYKNVSNYNGIAGNGTTKSITNPICLTSSELNTVYKIKMKNVLSDQLVVDEKGRLYQFNSNTNSTLNGISPVEYIEGTLGVKIVKSCTSEDKITYDNVSWINSIAIDENGKLWEGKYTDVTNLSEVEDSELAKKYKEDSNFKIEKIYFNKSAGYAKYAIDNYGKLWTWGANTSGQLGNGTTTNLTSPTCISDIDGVNLKNVESIEFIGATVIAKDKDGNVWVWGDNTNGKLGNGTTAAITKPYCINTEKLEGKAIKDIVIDTYGLILCDDDSVYVSGDTNINGKTEWINVGTCEGAEKLFMIQRIPLYIISGQNKVWTFGKNNPYSNLFGCCGTGSTEEDYIKTPTLISEEFTIKTCKSLSGKIQVIDTNGNLWEWGGSRKTNVIKPSKLYKEYKSIDYTRNDNIIDNKGIIHTKYTETYDVSKAIKDIYGEVNEENINKYINLVESNATYVLYNGKLWDIAIAYEGNMIYNCLNDTQESELYGKTIVDASKYKAIDSNGNLYVWLKYTGLESASAMPVCTTNVGQYAEATFKANNTIINVPDENNLYGVKIKQLINDKFVIDEKDNIWYFTESGKAENLSSNYEEISNPLKGKTIKQVINSNYIITEDDEIWYVGGQYPGYIMKALSKECTYISMNLNAAGYEYYIALDKDGKLWACGKDKAGYGILGTGNYDTKGEPVCLNDIKGTELYEATQNNPNFKMEKVLDYSSRYVFILDNTGKLWYWGNRTSNKENKSISPICVSNIEGTDLYSAYENDSTFKIVGKIDSSGNYIEDSNGHIWCIDNTTQTWKKWQDIYANGDLEIAFSNPDFRIKKVKWVNQSINAVVGNDGKLYINNSVSPEKYKVINNVGNVSDIAGSYSIKESDTNSLYRKTDRFVIFSDDGLYQLTKTTIMRRSYSSSTGWTPWETSYSNSTSKLASCKIKQIKEVSRDAVLALDENGKMWFAGYVGSSVKIGYDFGATTNVAIKCLSDDSNYALYGIEISEIFNDNYLKAKDGKIYTIAGKEYIDSNEHKELIEKIYGEMNNESISNFVSLLRYNSCIKMDNKWYKISLENSEVKLTEIDFTKENINKGIKLTKVVGENEVQAEDGTIYQIKPTSESTYEMVKVDEATPFEEYEIKPIEIEGSNIIKQTKYKALDDKGNLYVWDNYKGLTTTLSGVICLTNEKYYVEPIYLHSNGWTVIRNQY